MSALNANTKRAATGAVVRLTGAPEWAELIRVFRAETGGDRNYDELVDFLFAELLRTFLKQTDPIRKLAEDAS
jgi:hypothetical protein